MARLARVVVPGVPHHVTHRGNRKESVFFDDVDRRRYRAMLATCLDKHSVELWAYCLMSNHIHLVLVPAEPEALGRFIHDVQSPYTTYVNQRQGLCGHLWQGRFFSCPMDDVHLWAAVRYVERNPVRAGLTERADDYLWSSAPGHCGHCADPLLSGDLEKAGPIGDWAAWLQDQDDAEVQRLRRCTRTGRPLGSERFVARLENLLGRPLTKRKPGRKPIRGQVT